MKLVKFSIIAASLFLASCNNDKEPISNSVDNSKEEIFELTGSFQTPEMVELNENFTRAFTLRENSKKYPKVVLPDLDNGTNSFEPYFSSVWFVGGVSGGKAAVDKHIFVEDRGGDHAHEASTQLGSDASALSRQGSKSKGVSRILKIGDKYKVFIRFSSSTSAWINPYTTSYGYRIQVALNPLTNGGAEWPARSSHRIYVPTLYKTEHDTSPTNMEVSLPPLKLVSGDYHIGHSSSDVVVADKNNPTGPGNKLFRIPLISNYHYTKKADNSNFIKADLTFKMRGVLLSMKLRNITGKDIIVKRLQTKSNNLAYVGYYDIWHGNNDSNHSDTPVFKRASFNEWKFRVHTYTFNLQEENSTNPIRISANSESAGRVYLWGGIDKDTPNSGRSTKVQFVFSYADNPNREFTSKPLEITPMGASTRFEDGKVYLINLKIAE